MMLSRESCWEVSGCPTDFLPRSSHNPEDLVENSMGLLFSTQFLDFLSVSCSGMPPCSREYLMWSHWFSICTGISLHMGIHIVQRISWEISFKIPLHGDLHHDNPEGTSRSPKISHGLPLHRNLHIIQRISWKAVKPSMDFSFRGLYTVQRSLKVQIGWMSCDIHMINQCQTSYHKFSTTLTP